ncbi:nuclear transport factor 2 family protein [Geodermatophilus sp. CPCC 205761]|uniref:nuclear transport factor 2 family protein n=1 Tax=Geodermatophilus sp. CPCC 205761 TaxID=2936597 RepID=UPI003EEF2711
MGDDPLALEEQGWQALGTGPEAAAEFYARVLDTEVEMIFPGGARIDDRAAVLASMGGPPWESWSLEEPRVRELGPGSAVVTYGVVAHRAGAEPYSALVSSVYVRRDDGWRLAVHQQTPR